VFVNQPGVLLIGDATTVVTTIAFVLMGAMCLVIAFEGWLFGLVATPMRAALFVLAVALLAQTGVARWVAAAAFLALVAWRYRRRRPASPGPAPA